MLAHWFCLNSSNSRSLKIGLDGQPRTISDWTPLKGGVAFGIFRVCFWLTSFLHRTDEERAIFKEFLAKNIDVKIQIIPANTAMEMSEALKK